MNHSLIVQYRLYRKAKGQPEGWFALYKEFEVPQLTFDDQGLRADELYT